MLAPWAASRPATPAMIPGRSSPTADTASVGMPARYLPAAHAAGHRPGDDRHDLPRLRPAGRVHRARLPRVHAALPEARLGRARRGGDLGGHARGRGRGARGRGPGARRARGRRHHQPARDRRLLGPLDGRAAAPRARLAGPPHRRALRRAARGRRGGAHPRAHRADARPVLLGHQDRVAAAQRRRARRARPRRARGVRHGRLVDALQAHRRARRPSPPTRRARC